MRILQLGKFYPIRGGVEKVMRDLTEGLSEKGIACDMLCAAFDAAPIDPQDRPNALRKEGLLVIRLNPAGRIIVVKALAKIAGTMLSPALIRFLRRHCNNYDIIHIHHPDPMAALALRLSGYKGRVILHWHSDIVAQKTLLRFYSPLQKWLIGRAECIVGTTPVYTSESPHLKDAWAKCVCVPIGIKPFKVDSEAATRLHNSYSARFLILAVGRLVPYKGFSYLVGAMASLPDDYALVIIGEGPLRISLQQQAIRLGLSDRVIFVGRLEENGDFHHYFAACDVFVLPSVMKSEAFGIVQIEAMSCAKPVVSTRIPGSGVAWVNENGTSGLTVPPENPRALAGAIKEICEGAKPYQAYAEAARRRFERLFTRDRMIEQIRNLYENKQD